MKNLSIALMALALGFASCKKVVGDGPMVNETRNVTNFTGIDLRMGADVNFKIAPEFKVEVRAQDEILRVLDTYVSGEKLVIKFENDVRVRLHDGVSVTVTAPSLRSLRVSGSGDIRTTGDIQSAAMEMDISGSGDIDMQHLATDYLDATISGSGDIKVFNGTATEEKLKISGSGSINLAGVAAKNVQTRTSGSGDTRLRVSDRLDVTIAGSGSVYYTGTPVINASISGSGKVRQQ
ncbi:MULTISPECIES: head GIN domain-containing protein [Chitinophagaceae]|uniref:head GIN domain-containing protein n=1 Tax=Chitinophagaceae TaxID=563835 RepID=UPI000DEFF8B6|nr:MULTISPECIES: head GIN domain-containing protein [Chitinophagaceae]RPD50798.1 DUF2807 domain-containing protein [Paracnuella aquatica]